MEFISVTKWDDFQHYKERNPPWIKFYTTILNDYDIARLPDASKAHLFAIFLLASLYNNAIPADGDFIKSKINATEDIDLNILLATGIIEKNQGDKENASKVQAKRLSRDRGRGRVRGKEETASANAYRGAIL